MTPSLPHWGACGLSDLATSGAPSRRSAALLSRRRCPASLSLSLKGAGLRCRKGRWRRCRIAFPAAPPHPGRAAPARPGIARVLRLRAPLLPWRGESMPPVLLLHTLEGSNHKRAMEHYSRTRMSWAPGYRLCCCCLAVLVIAELSALFRHQPKSCPSFFVVARRHMHASPSPSFVQSSCSLTVRTSINMRVPSLFLCVRSGPRDFQLPGFRPIVIVFVVAPHYYFQPRQKKASSVSRAAGHQRASFVITRSLLWPAIRCSSHSRRRALRTASINF